jgi:serine/threonine protein kinase
VIYIHFTTYINNHCNFSYSMTVILESRIGVGKQVENFNCSTEIYTGFHEGVRVLIELFPVSYSDACEMKWGPYNENIEKFILRGQLGTRYNIEYIGYDEYEGRFCIIMEMVSGGNLHNFIKNERNREIITDELRLRWINQISEGILKLHNLNLSASITNTDNILLDDDLNVSISSISVMRDVTNPTALSGSTRGRVEYFPPELFEKHPEIGIKSDIYAFGTIVYEIMTGERLFKGMTPSQILTVVQWNDWMNSIEGPSALVKIIRECCNRNPEERHSSMMIMNE